MKFNLSIQSLRQTKTDCLILPVFAGTKMNKTIGALDKAIAGAISRVLKNGDLDGAIGHSVMLANPAGAQAKRILLVNLGKDKTLSFYNFESLCRKIYAAIDASPSKDAVMVFDDLKIAQHDAQAMFHQLLTLLQDTHYQFDRFKSKKKVKTLKKMAFVTTAAKQTAYKKTLNVVEALVSGINLTKDLANLPCNILNPRYLAKEGVALARKFSNVKTKVMGEKALKTLKMGSLLAVGQGSHEESHLVEVKYTGTTSKQAPVVLVGKGVTFDTGGISLKPPAAMEEMKYDMCGAATVLGVMHAIAKMKLKINVVGLVPTVENMPDGKSYRPGDILTSMSGQTIEVDNTDAEGRLILCDALTYAKRFKPATIIDIATLTGAVVVALGEVNTGLYSNNEKLAKALLSAGKNSEDTAWQLPLGQRYQKMMDSKVADMKNAGGRWAGSVTAACFLQRFVDDNQDWAHLDVAGTASKNGSSVGATGRPVPLLVNYLRSLAK